MRHSRWISTVVLVAALSTVIASQTPNGHAVFEQALAKERVEGNLPEAIRLYERVVTEFTSDRALAAKALVQVGLCYEKLGRDESVRAYERLLRDFSDQADAVSQARARLAVLLRPAASQAATMPGVRALPRMEVSELLSLSPDGNKAAFISYDQREMNLAVYDLASQQTKFLTKFDRTTIGYAYYPVWSPDSGRIAYLHQASRVAELRVATLDGKSDVIFRNEANPGHIIVPAGWVPDQSALLVALGRADSTFSIGFVPTTGGALFTPLRSGKWTEAWPDPPSLSRDGQWVAFADGAPGMREIQVISRDGRAAHRITDHPADDSRPLWSPDGRHLAFISNRGGGTALWTVAVRDGQPAGEPGRARDAMQDVALLDWTNSGLAYKQVVRTEDIYTMPVDRKTSEPAGKPRLVPFRRTGRNYGPAWSPDGKHLAFVSGSPAEPDRRSVVVLPNGGGEPLEFPIPTSLHSPLRWFGNSEGLGFAGEDATGKRVVFRLTLATGELKTYSLQGAIGIPPIEWNATGSRYYFVRHDFGGGSSVIVEHDLQSGGERIVYTGTGPKEIFSGLQFGPDRRWLALHRFKNIGRSQGILVVDIETGQSRVLLDEGITFESGVDIGSPSWSPDGRAILVARTEKQEKDLRLIPVAGGEVRRISLGTELTRLLSSGTASSSGSTTLGIAWSPDGANFAIRLKSARYDNWLLENPLAIAGRPNASARR